MYQIKSIAQIRLERLRPVREHFKQRTEEIREMFPFEIWSRHCLNWPHWDKLRVLICNTFGVTTVDQIPEDLVDDANELFIKVLNQLFDQNIKTMRLFQQQKEEENHG